MPALNFQARFAQAVRRGEKRMTIRALRADGRVPKVGAEYALYTGMRTKQCLLLARVVLTRVDDITLRPGGAFGLSARVNRQRWTCAQVFSLALQDGFRDERDMLAWFEKTHRINEQPFRGHVIRWDFAPTQGAGER